VDIVGDVDVSVTNIKLSNVALGNLQVVMSQPNQVSLTDSQGQITINMNWAYKQQSWPHASGSGSATVTTNSVSLTETVLLLLDVNSGKPSFQLTANTIDLGQLNINISGGSGWIISLLQSLFSSQIKSSVQNAVESGVSSGIASINNNIQATNMVPTLNMTIGSTNLKLTVDYRLTELAVLGSSFLSFGTRATFYDPSKGPSPLPFAPASIPNQPPSQIDDLIDGYGTDFVINSLMYGLYSSNQLQTVINSSMVPTDSPIQLNTTSLRLLIPQLYTTYPNKLVQLFVYTNPTSNPGVWPNIKITANNGGSISANFIGNIEFQVLMGDGTTKNAFILSLQANATLSDPKLIVSSGSCLNFTAQITNPQFSISVTQSWIGNVNVASLQQIIQVALIDAYLPILNKDLQSGIQLIDFSSILPGFNLINPNLILQNGYAIMGVNGYYSPSLLFKQLTGKKDLKYMTEEYEKQTEKIVSKIRKSINIQ